MSDREPPDPGSGSGGSPPGALRTASLTAITLVAFASNSILCRLALDTGSIDPLSYTAVRLGTGALVLWVIVRLVQGRSPLAGGDPRSALVLFVYAVPFSLAFVSLSAATGALLLFGTVQATMVGGGLLRGERPRARELVGLVVALGGLVYLVLPGLSAPSPVGSALMVAAGAAWGIYSLRGRQAPDPVAMTAGNFLLAAPLALPLALLWSRVTGPGLLWAALSGGLASGLGYVAWYAALRGLTATRAAVVQLAVPVLAATGGLLLLGEAFTPRLVLAAALILGGVALAVTGRKVGPGTVKRRA